MERSVLLAKEEQICQEPCLVLMTNKIIHNNMKERKMIMPLFIYHMLHLNGKPCQFFLFSFVHSDIFKWKPVFMVMTVIFIESFSAQIFKYSLG